MDAIIFDVDGTLWDSVDAVALSWSNAIKEHTDLNVTIKRNDLTPLFGKTEDEIVRILFPNLSPTQQHDLFTIMSKEELELVAKEGSCIIYDQVPETLSALSKKYTICLVSNCQSGYIESFLKATNLKDCITDYTCHGDTGRPKGENIKLIMERNQIKTAVYVGDTQTDKEACELAQIPMIYASYGFGTVENTMSIKKFDELLQIDFENFPTT